MKILNWLVMMVWLTSALAPGCTPEEEFFEEFVQIDVGFDHFCGITTEGYLTCTSAAGGQSSIEDTESRIFTDLSLFWDVVCAIDEEHDVYCYQAFEASPDSGEFYDDLVLQSAYDWELWDSSANHIGVAVGFQHACSILDTGEMKCWGNNSSGECDYQHDRFTSVAAGLQETCATLTDGSYKCWGRYQEQTAGGSMGDADYVDVALGGEAYALSENGEVSWMFGDYYGDPDNPGYLQLDGGQGHACALRTDGTIECWGEDIYGETVSPDGAYVQVAGGVRSTCGLDEDNHVTCWGYWGEYECESCRRE